MNITRRGATGGLASLAALPAFPAMARQGQVLNFQLDQNQMVTTVRLDGSEPLPFLIDSAALLPLVSTSTAERLKLKQDFKLYMPGTLNRQETWMYQTKQMVMDDAILVRDVSVIGDDRPIGANPILQGLLPYTSLLTSMTNFVDKTITILGREGEPPKGMDLFTMPGRPKPQTITISVELRNSLSMSNVESPFGRPWTVSR